MSTSNSLLPALVLVSATSAKRRRSATWMIAFMMWIFAPGLVKASTLGTLEATYGFHASGLLADPERPYMYATAGSELEVINTNTLAISASVSLPGTAAGMAMSADGSKLYIGGSNGVYVVNAQTDSLLSTLSLGYPVSQVAVGLNNRLYVLGDSQLAQVDATSGASTGPNVPVYIYSGGIQISPDSTTLYYATYGLSPGSLYKINVSTTTPQVTWSNNYVDYGENGEDLTLSRDGSMLSYVCGYGYQGYQIPNFRTSDMSVMGVFDTGAYPDALAYSPDGKYAYALHTVYPTAVDVYDTATYQDVGQFAVADRSSLMDLDASGRDLFVSFNGGYYGDTNVSVYLIPEPGTLVLLSVGALGLAACGWRKRRRDAE
ncbi:MAG: PEP-CTERM sorting domain-containing protein [Thermoguttaceae bacterium]